MNAFSSGLTPRRILSLVLVVAVVALGAVFGRGTGEQRAPAATDRSVIQRPAIEPGATQARVPDAGPTQHAPGHKAWGASVGFANRDRFEEHFEKHGAEFGSISKPEYLRRAQALRDAAVGGSILEVVKRDGVITRFDRASGAFTAFNPNGIIRTFFRPNDGERYFRRQAERDQ